MKEPLTHASALQIAAGHASLPGHFPGRPIVPGVLLLDCVLAEAERWLQTPLSVLALPQAKFLSPLLPSEPAQLRLRLDGADLRFEIERGGTTIASGTFKIAPRSGP